MQPGAARAVRFPGAGGPAEAPLLHLESRPDAWERWFHAMGVQAQGVNGMLVDQFALASQAAMSGLGWRCCRAS